MGAKESRFRRGILLGCHTDKENPVGCVETAPIHELASKLGSLPGISEVSIFLAEIDQSTESIKVSIDGTDISIDTVRKSLEELGAVIHSIDQVSVAKRAK